jgi:ATP-dependent helicase/nuclease subunit A
MLNVGAFFPENNDDNEIVGGTTEIYLLDSQVEKEKIEYEKFKEDKNTTSEFSSDNDSDDEPSSSIDYDEIDKAHLEARMVGNIIKNLMNSDETGKRQVVYDKKTEGYRNVKFSDIVILMRATSGFAPAFCEELTDMNIPVFADLGTGYFDTAEIKFAMSLLQVIDNPIQDIPLISVLRSQIYNFTTNDLANVRIFKKKVSFYESLKGMANTFELINSQYNKEELNYNKNLYVLLSEESILLNDEGMYATAKKAKYFLEKLEEYKIKSTYMSTHDFLWFILKDTGYYVYAGAMSSGAVRQANLRALFERAKQFEETSYRGIFNFINYIQKLKKTSDDMGNAKIIAENADVVRIMSIHKSKGLEFPIVICSASGKQFNMMDTKKSILCNYDLGFGPQFVDYKRRIQFKSIAKLALIEKMHIESLSEEMRILYVAMTRAKEKLIITGTVKDTEKSLLRWQESIGEDGKISLLSIINAKTFLDWIMPTVMKRDQTYKNANSTTIKSSVINTKINLTDTEKSLKDTDSNIWRLYVKKRSDLACEEKEIIRENVLENKLADIQKDDLKGKYYDIIDKSLNYKYLFDASTRNPSSISVTEIKKIHQEENEEMYEKYFDDRNSIEFKKKKALKRPKFIQDGEEKIKVTATEKGTVYHLLMQEIDLNRVSSKSQIKQQIDEFVNKGILTKNQADTLNAEKFHKFFDSSLGKRMLESKCISREKMIYTNINISKVFSKQRTSKKCLSDIMDENISTNKCDEIEDAMMLRGIIDSYFEEDGEIILIDYKTDFVNYKNESEIIRKYKIQLDLYGEVLEEITGKKVKEKWIYLFYIDKACKIM